MKKILIFIISTLLTIGCNKTIEQNSKKFNINTFNFIKVGDNIKDIIIKEHYAYPFLHIIDNYLLLLNFKNFEKGIYLYDKNTFELIANTGYRGRGPGEITNLGNIAYNDKTRDLWVGDYSKRVRWRFPLDSILTNSYFKPDSSLIIHYDLFLDRYHFLNDSIALGKAVHAINHNRAEMLMAKLNIKNNHTVRHGYEHPKAGGNKSNSYFSLSHKDSIYINAYAFCDLLTICHINGELKSNIYGPKWNNKSRIKQSFFQQVDIIDDFILASYIGEETFIHKKNRRPRSNFPSKILIFSKSGEHLKTIDVEYKFSQFCIDKVNKRVICYFEDRDNPFGFFNLTPILYEK